MLGYWEVHIEQGPKLESLGLPLGVVTGIAGARRATLMIKGKAGHAGTTQTLEKMLFAWLLRLFWQSKSLLKLHLRGGCHVWTSFCKSRSD